MPSIVLAFRWVLQPLVCLCSLPVTILKAPGLNDSMVAADQIQVNLREK